MAQKIKKNEEMTDLFQSAQTKVNTIKERVLSSLDTKKRMYIATGAVLLGGTAFTAISLDDDGKAIEPKNTLPAFIPNNSRINNPVDSTTHAVQGGTVSPKAEIPQAHSITDVMSFDEAFQTARTEVGPGGTFEYQGNIYSTYLKGEWDSLSIGERMEFLENIDFKPLPFDAPIPPVENPLTSTDSTQAPVQGIKITADSTDTPIPIADPANIDSSTEKPTVTTDSVAVVTSVDTTYFGEIPPIDTFIDSPISTESLTQSPDPTKQDEFEAIKLVAEEVITKDEFEEIALVEEEIYSPEPIYIEISINGIRAIGIDEDNDGLADAIIFQNPETGVIYSLVDSDADGALETLATFDMETGQVASIIELNKSYEVDMEILADMNDMADLIDETLAFEEVDSIETAEEQDNSDNVKADEMPMDDDDYNNNTDVTDMD